MKHNPELIKFNEYIESHKIKERFQHSGQILVNPNTISSLKELTKETEDEPQYCLINLTGGYSFYTLKSEWDNLWT